MANPLSDAEPAAVTASDALPVDRPADELLLSLLFLPDTGAALDEVEALAEDDLSRLLIF